MYYVYLDSFYGTELIGKSENYDEALNIKKDKDMQWQKGYRWSTRITTVPQKEYSSFD